MSSKIFLAHASEDKPLVRQLHADLRRHGLDPWLDEIDLMPGQNWKIEIERAIADAAIFLACLSQRSVGKKGYVQHEFRSALVAYAHRPPDSIYLIPVRLDGCEMPDLRIPDLGLSLTDYHWVDLFEPDGLNRLVETIRVALREAQGPKKPLKHPIGLAESAEPFSETGPDVISAADKGHRAESVPARMASRNPTIAAAIITGITAIVAAVIMAPWL